MAYKYCFWTLNTCHCQMDYFIVQLHNVDMNCRMLCNVLVILQCNIMYFPRCIMSICILEYCIRLLVILQCSVVFFILQMLYLLAYATLLGEMLWAACSVPVIYTF